MQLDRFQGCLLGLALGDALGAGHEGGAFERLLWRVIGRTKSGDMRWTDDTQMSLDTAESLVANGRVVGDDLARRYAASYRWSRGYGPGAAKLLKLIAAGEDWRTANRQVFPDGSYGNGGAMRAPVVGLFWSASRADVIRDARESASVTHAHPHGMEGAVLVACSTATASCSGDPTDILDSARSCAASPAFTERLDIARAWLQSGHEVSAREVRSRLGNGVAATESCVTAIYLGCRFHARPFVELQAFVHACGGDADTIGAMSGALWGAANGTSSLPREPLERLELRDRVSSIAQALHGAAVRAASRPVSE